MRKMVYSVFRILLQVLRNIDLVYGGGSIGLMGLVSQAVHDGGRHVIWFLRGKAETNTYQERLKLKGWLKIQPLMLL
ncbi:unnamed protein product [Arabidopsis lyrata]|uniref:Uncharacterized protein n=1 Tax=Arabidopsis lyrata subsp. lyrata TaxID=81972 RepID=D7MTI6_ARALL|nr:hypothetical protein ARALYDRAFT_918466 [Arabidopsis lyrata subsp. lyrata]CAH8279547.1 unnamed protein product [Arabidopsis lyrata]